MVNVISKSILLVFAVVVISSSAFALLDTATDSVKYPNISEEQADVTGPVPSFSVLLVQPTLSTTLVDPSEPVSTAKIPSESFLIHSRSEGSSLSTNELKVVMSGGRNWNPFTKKWGYRDALKGEKRNNFLLSWEAHRKRSNANQLLPSNQLFSK